MKAIRYRIHLDDNILVTALEGDPNSAVAFDYLPGSVLRGAIIGRYITEKGDLSLNDADTYRRFFNGQTCYLNAHPVINGHRSYPTPLSWIETTSQPHHVRDELLAQSTSAQEKRKGIKKPFYIRNAAEVIFAEPERNIAVHIQRSRKTVATGEGSTVYRYDSLARGQTFEAIILCDHDADAEWLLPYLNGEHRLGGAAGYGQTSWFDAEIIDSFYQGPPDDGAGEWVIALMSNALVRDANGQYAADQRSVQSALEAMLGHSIQVQAAFLDSEMVGGFNRKWGLPLPQALSVRMGSVLWIKGLGTEPAAIQQLRKWGIGERQTEGFGRVAVYQQQATEFISSQYFTVHEVEDVTLDGWEADIARAMIQRIQMNRRQIEIQQAANQLVPEANQQSKQQHPEISNAQIGELRQLIANARRQTPVNTGHIVEFLEHTDAKGQKAFTDARLGKQSLSEWIRAVINQKQGLPEAHSLTIGQVSVEPGDDADAALSLIDAVLARIMRSKKEEEKDYALGD
jgi:CRISPR-associated protein Csx10